MWKRKELKVAAKHSLWQNYIACVAVCFVMMLLAGEYQSTVQFILRYDNRNAVNLQYDTDQKIEIVKEVEKISGGEEVLKSSYSSEIDSAIDKIAQKYDIEDKQLLRSWVDVYVERGASALSSKQISALGSLGEDSNWKMVTRTLQSFVTDDVDAYDEKPLTEEISYFFDVVTKEDSSKIGVINYVIRIFSQPITWRLIILFVGSLLSLFLTFFVEGLLIVGEKRFFMETRTYHKTHIGRIGFLFKRRCFRPVITMLLRDLYRFLWSFTIIGGIIKEYEYEMIPYILAENPKIDRKKAFNISKQMMKGNKWRSFLIDLSFAPIFLAVAFLSALIGQIIWGLSYTSLLLVEICCSILMTVFLNPYKTATKTELYFALRKEAIKQDYLHSEYLNDKYLDLDLLEEQLDETVKNEVNV